MTATEDPPLRGDVTVYVASLVTEASAAARFEWYFDAATAKAYVLANGADAWYVGPIVVPARAVDGLRHPSLLATAITAWLDLNPDAQARWDRMRPTLGGGQ